MNPFIRQIRVSWLLVPPLRGPSTLVVIRSITHKNRILSHGFMRASLEFVNVWVGSIAIDST